MNLEDFPKKRAAYRRSWDEWFVDNVGLVGAVIVLATLVPVFFWVIR